MGFVFAALFLWLARPSWRTMAAESGVGAAGTVAARLCVWICEEGCGADHDRAVCAYAEPAVSGVDADCVRVCGGRCASWVILVALAALFAAIYIPTIQSEEAYLREHFAGFEAYARAVPRLLPMLSCAAAGDKAAEEAGVAARGRFSTELYHASPRVQFGYGRGSRLSGAGGTVIVLCALTAVSCALTRRFSRRMQELQLSLFVRAAIY